MAFFNEGLQLLHSQAQRAWHGSCTTTTEVPGLASPMPPPVIRTIAWLGYGGLLPFVLLTIATAVDKDDAVFWSQALFSYGSVILTFVGALHWGFALAIPGIPDKQRDAVLIWSVVPALVAWVALMFDGVDRKSNV